MACQFRNAYSKLESPLDWDDQRLISSIPCSCAGDIWEIEDDEQDTNSNEDDNSGDIVVSRTNLDPSVLSCWKIPYIDPSDGCFRPELSILRSVCPERKIPARCLQKAK
jgi:hypothetical protein